MEPTAWCLVGNGGMDPYSSPCIIPKLIPITHSPKELLRLMDKILHDLKDPKLWELW